MKIRPNSPKRADCILIIPLMSEKLLSPLPGGGIAKTRIRKYLFRRHVLLNQIHIRKGEIIRCCRVIVTDAKGSFMSVNVVSPGFLVARKSFAQTAQLI